MKLTRALRLATILLTSIAIAVVGPVPTASAQDTTAVVGSADFRSPPQLVDGLYEDSIVTGETVWYSVMYSNETPYRFEVSLPDLDPNDGLAAELTLFRPNLEPQGKRASLIESSGSTHDASHTNLWYLTVDFGDDAAPGVAHRVLIEVAGVESTTLTDCSTSSECTFDQELASLVGDLATVEDALAEFDGIERTGDVEREIENLNGFLETAETLRPQRDARLATAESSLAAMCAPEPVCDAPNAGSAAPIWALGLGLLALLGGGYKAVNRLRPKDEEEEEEEPRPLFRPGSQESVTV